MKKNKNKGKKKLTAVSAVVAASLTPGIMAAATPGLPIKAPNAAITAAQVVSIDGNTYSFDELFALQQPGVGRCYYAATSVPPQHATRYGAPTSPVNPPIRYSKPQQRIINGVAEGLDTIQDGLMEFCAQVIDADPYTNGILFTIDSDLTREIGMSEEQLKELKAIIEEYYRVEVSYHRFYLKGQLNTLRLISEYIFKLKTIWD
jgi:hypothetical protein